MKSLRPLLAGFLFAASLATAAPRMISFEYPNCYSCHVAVQGRGLLNARGRGIDIEQSYSELDATAALLGSILNPEFNNLIKIPQIFQARVLFQLSFVISIFYSFVSLSLMSETTARA